MLPEGINSILASITKTIPYEHSQGNETTNTPTLSFKGLGLINNLYGKGLPVVVEYERMSGYRNVLERRYYGSY